MAGLSVSPATVRRVSEQVGRQIAAWLGDGQTLGPTEDWDWHQDADGDTVAYVSLDATGVPQQQGQGGKAEGKMAYVGMIYNPAPDPERVPDASSAAEPTEPMKARYISGLYELWDLARCCVGREPKWGWTERTCGWRWGTGAAATRSSWRGTSLGRVR